MFTLLNSIALFGLGLLAIPIIVHLFKPRKVRQMPFSSLRWMRASRHHMSRRIRWHQVLLFLIRAAFLVLVVLVLARPALSPGGGTQPAERFIVLDVSRSMGYKQAGRPTPIELGKRAVRQLIEHSSASDRTAVVLSGAEPVVIGPLTANAERYVPRLNAVRAGACSTDLTATLRAIRPMLSTARPGAAAEIVFVTDSQQQKWSQAGIAGFLRGLKIPVRAKTINVRQEDSRNAWIADARAVTPADGSGTTVRVRLACDGDRPDDRTVFLSNLPGQQELSEPVTIQPGRLAEAEFKLPAKYDVAGKVGLVRLEPTDGLPDYDTWWVNFSEPSAARVLVVEPKPTHEDLAAGLHLRAAMETLSSAMDESISIVRRTPEDVSEADVSAAGVIFLADVPRLPDPIVRAVTGRVKSGGGLGVFLGPTVDAAFYNDKLSGLLAARLKGTVNANAARGRLARLTGLRRDAPLFGGPDGPGGDTSEIGLMAWHDMEISDGEVIAAIDNGPPAIAERRVGAGTVVVFNTTANDQWSNLARWANFVPLVDRLLAELGGRPRPGGFEAGRPVDLMLPGAVAGGDEGSQVVVVGPDGRKMNVAAVRVHGVPALHMDAADQPGIYRVDYSAAGKRRTVTFTVQVSRNDSRLTVANADTLRAWWAPAEFQVVQPDPTTGALSLRGGWIDLAPWLMGLACLMLLAEMFLVHWLCPAVNPTVVSSVVARHGLLAGDDARVRE